MAKSGELRKLMEEAVSFLACRQLGLGTDVERTKKATDAVCKWKTYFVHYMQHETDNDRLEAEVSRLFGIELETMRSAGKIDARYFTDKRLDAPFGTKVPCVEDIKSQIRMTIDTRKFEMGKVRAAELADQIIQRILDAEVEAMEEGISRYNARDPGPVEFGEIKFPVPQFAEIPTGEFYNALEDEDATSWTMPEIHYYDDEIVDTHENQYGVFVSIDHWTEEDQHNKTVELRDAIEAATFQDRGKVLRRALNCYRIRVITWDQYCYLKIFAQVWLPWKLRRDLPSTEIPL